MCFQKTCPAFRVEALIHFCRVTADSAVRDLKVESCTLGQVKQGERTSPFIQQKERERERDGLDTPLLPLGEG